MSVLGEEALVVTRPSGAGSWDPDTGLWAAAGTTTVNIRGSVQPLEGEDLERLPEGQRSRRPLMLFTEAELRTADEAAGTEADLVDVDGESYAVERVARHRKVLPHYEVLLLRVEAG